MHRSTPRPVPAAPTCRHCAATGRPGARFCRRCGHPLPHPWGARRPAVGVLAVGLVTAIGLVAAVGLAAGRTAGPLADPEGPRIATGAEETRLRPPDRVRLGLEPGPCRARCLVVVGFRDRSVGEAGHRVRIEHRRLPPVVERAPALAGSGRRVRLVQHVVVDEPFCVTVAPVPAPAARTAPTCGLLSRTRVGARPLLVDGRGLRTPLDLRVGQCADRVPGQALTAPTSWVRLTACTAAPAVEVFHRGRLDAGADADGQCRARAATHAAPGVAVRYLAWWGPGRSGRTTLTCAWPGDGR